MRLKLEISPQLIGRFEVMLNKQLGKRLIKFDINDLGSQYQFEFTDPINNGRWHFELDKECNAGAWYTLHCSTQELHLPIHYIKDIRIFCQQIGRIQQMQNDFLASKYNHT
jgi:hypothetical protein